MIQNQKIKELCEEIIEIFQVTNIYINVINDILLAFYYYNTRHFIIYLDEELSNIC